MASLAPRGVATLVPAGGHALHLAQPDQAARVVRHWLGATGPAAS
jgi:pimeloyl-ACP methyl ester carboxylesterase